MSIKVFLTIFGVVFLAELGDKTQLATMLFATDEQVSKWLVFVAAASALVVATALGVLAGSLLGRWIDPKWLSYLAGTGFMLIGALTIFSASTQT